MAHKVDTSRAGILGTGLTIALGLALLSKLAANAGHEEHQDHYVEHLNHITTQAQAEALKQGDSIAMACSMCKHISIHHVTKDNSHVKLLTIGEKHKCVCGGTVTVVGTGKGNGKNEEVEHVCSSCGNDVMFVCATKPGSGEKHHQHQE